MFHEGFSTIDMNEDRQFCINNKIESTDTQSGMSQGELSKNGESIRVSSKQHTTSTEVGSKHYFLWLK